MLRTSSNPWNQATVQDGRVVVQNVQGRQNRGQGNNVRGAGTVGYGGAQNKVRNANPGQARQVKCYNCNSICHIARNCTKPKRPQNSEYFKDKMLLMQALENRVALDEEQLLFPTGRHDNVVDEDVDEQPVQDYNVFQADDCDAFNSNGMTHSLGLILHGSGIEIIRELSEDNYNRNEHLSHKTYKCIVDKRFHLMNHRTRDNNGQCVEDLVKSFHRGSWIDYDCSRTEHYNNVGYVYLCKLPYSSSDEDIGHDHIPMVNLRQNWWKPLTEDRPATPELAWSISLSDLPVPVNNLASALASTYAPPP
ncbi:retrovirus-related pol polyprotein from transposon TNT 1-94 [Tanacetum coccineum]